MINTINSTEERKCPTYYFQLNNVITQLSKPTARWLMTYYRHKHSKGKRMYQSKNPSTDKYKYTFCDILYDIKHRTECIVVGETPCYVTVAVFQVNNKMNPTSACRKDFFTRRRWKSNDLKRANHILATMQELSAYVYDLDVLFQGLRLESVN